MSAAKKIDFKEHLKLVPTLSTAKAVDLPAGVIKRGDEELPASADTKRLAIRGWEIKCLMDELKAEQAEINAQLIKSEGLGTGLSIDGMCSISISERQTVTVSDADALKATLKGRFRDLVDETTTFKPTKKLIAMSCDATGDKVDGIRSALAVKVSQSVTYRAAKPAKAA